MKIDSSPEASFTIVDRKGNTVYSSKTPDTVELHAASDFLPARYRIIFEEEGYRKREVTIDAGIDLWVIGNVIFGPGTLPGVVIDALTGSMYTLEGKNVLAQLKPESPPKSLKDGTRTLHVFALDDVPTHLRPHLVRIDQ